MTSPYDDDDGQVLACVFVPRPECERADPTNLEILWCPSDLPPEHWARYFVDGTAVPREVYMAVIATLRCDHRREPTGGGR